MTTNVQDEIVLTTNKIQFLEREIKNLMASHAYYTKHLEKLKKDSEDLTETCQAIFNKEDK